MGMTCDLLVGGSRDHASDYFEGTIRDARGVSLGDVSGTYLGYVDIDGERFWDIRHVPGLAGLPREDTHHSLALASDTSYRQEIVDMWAGRLDAALEVKAAMEAQA